MRRIRRKYVDEDLLNARQLRASRGRGVHAAYRQVGTERVEQAASVIGALRQVRREGRHQPAAYELGQHGRRVAPYLT
jgi:hypothetical protein